jgi:hypothetical protein
LFPWLYKTLDHEKKMKTLRATDGTEPHLRALRFQTQRCRQRQSEPFFAGLIAEGTLHYQALKSKSREVEDAAELMVERTADIDGAELFFEDEVRNCSETTSTLERKRPELGLYAKLFPKGINGVINAERKKQVAPAFELLDRLSAHTDITEIQSAYKQIKNSTSVLEQALLRRDEAEREFKQKFAQEQQLRTTAREFLVSALARLTDRYKSNPSLAESFFIDDPKVGSTALSQAELRGKVSGKQEVLLVILQHRGEVLSPEQREALLSVIEEEKLDRWVQRALDGATITELLVPPKENPPQA